MFSDCDYLRVVRKQGHKNLHTISNSLSVGMLFMRQFPKEFTKLNANPGLLLNAVFEISCYQSAVAHLHRTTLADHEIRGRHIAKGDRVVI